MTAYDIMPRSPESPCLEMWGCGAENDPRLYRGAAVIAKEPSIHYASRRTGKNARTKRQVGEGMSVEMQAMLTRRRDVFAGY
jgi:hypothetical protein